MTAPRNPRFPLFDSLRAIAALSVLLFHIAFVLEGFTDPNWGRYATQLNIGVTLFFLISGFLLYRPFARARFAGDPFPSVGAYATRRLFRIVPAYWVALVVIALWIDLPIVFEHWYLHFTFLHVYEGIDLLTGVGHTWTLAVEMTFYLFLPLWAFALSRVPVRSPRQFALTELGGLAVLFAIGVVWNLTQIEKVNGVVLFSTEVATLPRFLDHFALGMGVAVASVVLAERARQPGLVRLVERRSWLPWLAAAATFVLLCEIGSGYASHDVEPLRHELRGLVALCLLLPAVFGEGAGGAVRRLLASRALMWVGLISYSLYLWHPAIVRELVYTDLDEEFGWWLPAILSAIASIVVAAISFYLVERPALRLGRRLSGRRDDPGAPGAGAGLGAPADEAPADVPTPSGAR